MKKIISIISTIFVIVLISFLWLKTSITSIISLPTGKAFEKISPTGEKIKIFTISSGKMLILKQYEDLYDYAIVEVKGCTITHYFGPLYNTSESLFGLKWLPDATEAWTADMILIKKGGNLKASSFQGKEGQFIGRMLIVLSPNNLTIGGDEFKKCEITEDDLMLIVDNKISI